MSKGLGIGVLVVGLGILGWWAHGHNAPRMQSMISQEAVAAVAGSVHGATATVSGRDIVLSGIADGPEEEASLLSALDALPGRRLVINDLTVLDKITPFTLDVTKDATALTAKGYVPTEAMRAVLAGSLGDTAAGLILAAGSPTGWGDLAKAGLAALAPLNKGTLSISDSMLKISGEALGPDEAAAVDAALAALPAGSVTKDITLLDDGTPAEYSIDYQAATGATVSGKLPKGVDLPAIATALGLGKVVGTVSQGLLGEGNASAAVLGVFKDWMGAIETLKVKVGENGIEADAKVADGADLDGLRAALAGANVAGSVDVAVVEGQNGTMRTNAATGAEQRFMGGYWLAVPQIDVGLQGCQAAADGVLEKTTITFLSGSDELDPSAVRVINELGAIMARCAEEAKLKAVIGGHTDAQGDAQANLGLSQRRAIAVRLQLIARGVPGAALKSVGYGADVPIADNGTEEGRAKNRRTTINWSE